MVMCLHIKNLDSHGWYYRADKGLLSLTKLTSPYRPGTTATHKRGIFLQGDEEQFGGVASEKKIA